MRAITKGTEPASLTRHRMTPHCNYENYSDKDELRQRLVTEQRGLCCYCMGRIQGLAGSMKIEHWQCQADYEEEQLTYRNILGACLGGEGQPGHLQHCDTRKGNSPLRWNPADSTHSIETRIHYEADGSIRAGDATFNSQLNKVLNLNLAQIRNSRKGVLTGILEWWKTEKAKFRGPVPRARFERKRDKCLIGNDDLAPYCQVMVWWLNQRLMRMA